MYKSVHKSPTEPRKEARLVYNVAMWGFPNQISSERADLLVQVARCRRLAKEVDDQPTVHKLLALTADYEERLKARHHE